MALLRRFFVKTTGHDVALPTSVNTGVPLLDKSSPHLRSGDAAHMRNSPPQPQEIHQDRPIQKTHFLRHPSMRTPQTRLSFNTGVHRTLDSPVNPMADPLWNGASDCGPYSFTPRVNGDLEPLACPPQQYSFIYPFERNNATSECAAQTHVPDVLITPSTPTAFTSQESQQGYSNPSSESVTASSVSNSSARFFNALKLDSSSNFSISGPSPSSGSVSQSHQRTISLTGTGASRAQEEREPHRTYDQPSGGIRRRRSSSISASINMSWEAIASSFLDTPPSSSKQRHSVVIPTSLSCLWESRSDELAGKASSIPYDTPTLINEKSDMDGTSTGFDTSIDHTLFSSGSDSSKFEGTKQSDVFDKPGALPVHAVGHTVSSGPDPAQEVEPPYTDVFDLDMYFDPVRWSRNTQTRRSICSISTNTSSSMSKYSTSTSSVPDIEKTLALSSPASSVSSGTISLPRRFDASVSETKLNVSDSAPMLPDIYRLRRQGFVPPSSSSVSLKQEIIRDKDHYRSSAYSRAPALVTESPTNRIRILSTSSSFATSLGLTDGYLLNPTFNTGHPGVLKLSASTFMVPRKATPVASVFVSQSSQDPSSTHISGAKSNPALKPRITFKVANPTHSPNRIARTPTGFPAGPSRGPKEVKVQRRVLKKRTRPMPNSYALPSIAT
ncbi:hypothetical protein CPB83DRAFT_899867 [Crepidotus variabilis]|uniref:Uncharacterized protein n=1 Tax=Crepidotus variabilis TaxID=179855 RepID=A0A9P6E403_9AGAR|nr:hypothetical protein CPB83DRAFT_899867 [Crepidotus variabilis]